MVPTQQISRPGEVAPKGVASNERDAEFAARHPSALWRANVVGRLSLWSGTLFLSAAALAAFTSFLWLLTPLAEAPQFILLHRVLLAITFAAGFALFVSLFILQRFLVPSRNFGSRPLGGARVHVALTAYNDELCIADAVREFKSSPLVHKVIVIENNSADATRSRAIDAGADEVITETIPGYGACCIRALAEGADDADVVILCEGDMTFSAADVSKFLAYLENGELVLGTRATQELRDTDTQMDWLINPFNQIVAKLIQTRFWGTRLTDCGCTYRAMRVDSYKRLAGRLRVRGNHFSPHMYMEALKMGMRVIEIPVTFRKRQGLSKGVGTDKVKAARVALRMLWTLYRM